MKYEVAVAFGFYSVGAVIEPTGTWRSMLEQRGWIKPLPETRTAPVEAAIAVEPETATVKAPRRSRRK